MASTLSAVISRFAPSFATFWRRHPLSDGSITLRPYSQRQAREIYEAVIESQQELRRWTPWWHRGEYTLWDSQNWIFTCRRAFAAGTDYCFAIIDTRTRTFVGHCGLSGIDHGHKAAQMGYWVRTECTRQGKATAAARLLAKYAFYHLGLHEIEILVPVMNLPSQKVATRMGAKRSNDRCDSSDQGHENPDLVRFILDVGSLIKNGNQ